MRLMEDIFLYFARYCTPQVVGAFFPSSGDQAYEALRAAAESIAGGLCPDIMDYIFGVNEDTVARRISEVQGIYLFVDYGNITSTEDLRNVKSDEFALAVTVAMPTSSNMMDMAQELILSDKLLSILASIREDMRRDESDSFVSRLLFPNEITPFFARELSNSYGWTMMFKMKGIDWL